METRLGEAFRKALAEKEQKANSKKGSKSQPTGNEKGGGSGARVSPNLDRVRAVKVGTLAPHRLLSDTQQQQAALLKPTHGGAARQLAVEARDAADLILGIDFGTASTKAVILDHTAGRSYAVPFRVGDHNQYLVPSRVVRSPNGYSLDGEGVVCGHLKTRLLECGTQLPVAEFEEACAFLALVIRHCRGWLLERYASVYAHHELKWTINVGLPSRSYENESTVQLFRRLAFASSNLAADAGKARILPSDVREYRELSLDAYSSQTVEGLGGFEFLPQDIDVIPEIAAQVFGYVHSQFWDPRSQPYICLMDVGAGTLDTAFFAVLPNTSNDLRFVFYSADVRSTGTARLHRARMSWVSDALRNGGLMTSALNNWVTKLQDAGASRDRIPGRVEDYVTGVEYTLGKSTTSIDRAFHNDHVITQASDCVNQARTEQRLMKEWLRSIPLFICGGGARLPVFGNVTKSLNERWQRNSIGFARTELPKPRSFEVPGLDSSEYDRLSVAYGLSRHGAGGRRLGDVIRRAKIPQLPPKAQREVDDRYVSKDQM